MTDNIRESSLTAPEDRTTTITNPWKPDRFRPLTDGETDAAMTVINDNSFIGFDFPRKDRVYSDPPIFNQTYSLFSFVPAKGATPNEHSVFGYIKIRGCYGTDIEASQKAEEIIRNVDSYHTIYHAFTGKPMPLTSSSKYTKEVSEIDIRKQMTESVSAEIKRKKFDEKRTMEEIQQRETELLEESRKIQAGEDVEDQFETYITLKVKKAQLVYTYVEHQKKMEEIRHILVKTRKELEELEALDPTYKDKYFDKYKNAREKAGIKLDDAQMQENFVKFMVEDYELPEIDDLYNKTYNTINT